MRPPKKQNLTCSSSSPTTQRIPQTLLVPSLSPAPDRHCLPHGQPLACLLLSHLSLILSLLQPAQLHPFLLAVLILAIPSKCLAQSPPGQHFCCVATPFVPKFETLLLPSPPGTLTCHQRAWLPSPCWPSFS